MTEKTTIDQISEKLLILKSGPDWLKKQRESSRSTFNKTPLPRRGLHLWRYTDPQQFVRTDPATESREFSDSFASALTIEKEHLKAGHLSGLVTDFGGKKIEIFENGSLSDSKVTITPLSKAVETHSELVGKYFYQLINESTGKFESLNGTLWEDGIFIHVPDNVVVEKPLHLLREAGVENSLQYPRLLVVVGRNAEITVIDEYTGGSKSYRNGYSHSNAVVEIFGEADSRTRYVSLQRQGRGMLSYSTHRAKLERGATMLTIPIVFGAAVAKQNFGISLDGENANSNIVGLLFATDRQHHDNHTLHHHTNSHTSSNIDFKVVLRDKALSAYTGLIKIDKEARVCEAYQTNRNLLLNPGTKAETIPELEILNEDVSCSHGATVGPIDPMEIFYIMCRGISRSDAEQMVVSGFLEKTLKILPDDLHGRISNLVSDRIEES